MTPFSDALWVFAPNFGDDGTGEQGTSLMLCLEWPKFSQGWVLPLHPASSWRGSSEQPCPAACPQHFPVCLFFCLFKSF